MCLKNYLTIFFVSILTLFTLTTSFNVHASVSKAELFSEYSPDSVVEIDYPDVDYMLEISVLDLGPSDRELAKRSLINTGTRFKERINRLTALESNRVYFGNFNNQSYREMLDDTTATLAAFPDQMSLKSLNKNEQLAYWLNLYNMALLREIALRQSEERIQFEFAKEQESSFFNRTVLNVEGHDLSLNDIKYDIVLNNFKGNENVIYGFFTGVICGPSIQKYAFTGKNVSNQLSNIAREFINSNRGTYFDGRLSILYDRYQDFFSGENKASAIQKHILSYIDDDLRDSIDHVEASELAMDIVDFSKASIFNSRRYGTGNSIASDYKRNRSSLLSQLFRKYYTNKATVTVTDLSESEVTSQEH